VRGLRAVAQPDETQNVPKRQAKNGSKKAQCLLLEASRAGSGSVRQTCCALGPAQRQTIGQTLRLGKAGLGSKG
jgi:hypothetical protein